MIDPGSTNAGTARIRIRFGIANLSIFLDEVVFFALAPLLPIYAAMFDLSKTEVGWLFAVYPLLSFASALPGSALCTRIGPRWVLVLANVVFAAATISFGIADSELTLWTSRGLQGLASGITVTAAMLLIARAGKTGRKGRTLGIAFAIQGLSAIGGPALGGLVVPHLGAATSFAFVALVAATSAVILVIAGDDRIERSARFDTRSLVIAMYEVLRSESGRYPVLLFVGIGITAGCVQTLTTLQLAAAGVSSSEIGLLFITAGVIAIPVVITTGWLCDRIGPVRATRWWLITEIAMFLSLALLLSTWAQMIALSILLIQSRSGGTIAYAQAAQTDRFRGMAIGIGLMIMAWAVGSTIGSTLAGTIADAIGNSPAYVVTMLLLVLLVGPGATLDLRGRRRN